MSDRDQEREVRWAGGKRSDRTEPSNDSPPTQSKKKRLVLIIATLALGALGGWVLDLLQMPLAWMIGSLLFTTVFALAGASLERSQRLRNVTVPVLGLMLGSAFTPDALDHVQRWLPSLAILILYVIVVTSVTMIYLRKVAGFGPVTAYFSAAPGGFGEMVLLGEAAGGDDRRISLIHSIRIMITVLVIPFYFAFTEGYEPGGLERMGSLVDLSLKDGALFIACAAIGVPLFKRLGLPAATLLGPAILSGAVHLAGLSTAQPPFEIIAIAQVVIGSGIGCRFAGVAVRRVIGTLLHGVGVTVMMIGLALAAAYGLSVTTGLDFNALWLSFAPGGLAEMTLISIALGIDVAFVSTHHVIRMLFLVAVTSTTFELLKDRLNLHEDPPDKSF